MQGYSFQQWGCFDGCTVGLSRRKRTSWVYFAASYGSPTGRAHDRAGRDDGFLRRTSQSMAMRGHFAESARNAVFVGFWPDLVSEGFQKASGEPFRRIPLWGRLTRRLRRGWWGCRPEGGSTFFRRERKYQRKHAARRLQRRPTSLCTAAKPCAALGLGYALHGFQPFLALVGLRPPLVAGFGLR